MIKVVILNHLTEERLQKLAEACPEITIEAFAEPEDALPHMADADALALWGYMDPRPLLEAGPQIRWLHSLSAGIENLLPPEVRDSDIILTHTGDVHNAPVAERTMTLLLTLSHRMPECLRAQNAHRWKRYPFVSLEGKTMLIAGFGGIGKEIARRAKAFGMRIIACKRSMTQEELADEVILQDEILARLGEADVVACALPGTPETDSFFRAEHFGAMKKCAYFINVARGSLVDEEALLQALRGGEIAGAGLDVFRDEPLPENSLFWKMENVVLTAHTAAMVDNFFPKVLSVLGDNIRRFATGEELLYRIDKERGY